MEIKYPNYANVDTVVHVENLYSYPLKDMLVDLSEVTYQDGATILCLAALIKRQSQMY